MEKISDFELFDAKVDKYLRNQMTAVEEREFMSELSLDAEKRTRAKITALMVKTMQKEGMKQDQNIVDSIRQMDEKSFRKALGLRTRIIRMLPKYVRIAAAACVVGIISMVGYHYYEYNKTVSLGNDQYLAYNLDILETDNIRGNKDKFQLNKLENLFANVKDGKDIEKTILELERLYDNSFQEGSIYCDYLDDISWNLAIAYLKNGEREKPIPILESMLKRNKDYPEIAQPIQKLINKIKEL